MKRYRIRYSRGLMGILAIMVVVALVAYGRTWLGTRQADATPARDAAAPELAKIKIEKLETPATGPATKPAIATNIKAVFVESARLKTAGDMLGARKALMSALNSGSLAPDEHDNAIALLSDLNGEIIFSTKKFMNDELADQYVVQSGERMATIAKKYDIPWEFIGRLNNITDPTKLRAGQTLKIYKGPFHALVNKKAFTLDLFAGGRPGEPNSVFLKRFRVGLGENDSTPTGVWQVEPGKKLKNPRYYSTRPDGPRVIEPDDPTNPLGERWIGLVGIEGKAVGKTSYGIHGTIDPDSIGKMRSMGCVRLLNQDVEWVYDMLAEGKSTVTVID